MGLREKKMEKSDLTGIKVGIGMCGVVWGCGLAAYERVRTHDDLTC